MKREHWAAIANFFLPGTGYLIGGVKRMLAVLWLIGVIGLTYVEFGIREPEPTLYAIMFASVLIMNVAFAIDAYREVKAADAERVPANQGTLGADTPQAS
jgi:hypothetical protein